MSKQILVVDDTSFMRMTLTKILTGGNYDVVDTAESGVVAVEKFEQHRPGLVIMDITMPDMDGIQAVQKIKQIDPAAKVIMCSAMGQQSMVIDAIKAGAQDFIVKPFKGDRVLEAVAKIIGPPDA
ncbi:MAG: two-component system response regulator [Clostridiales bacterium]|nr:MAG: two-component system response regulator [Clostridiales bacterium]